MRRRSLISAIVLACLVCMPGAFAAASSAGASASQPARVGENAGDVAPKAAPVVVPHSDFDSKEIRRAGEAGSAPSSSISKPASLEMPRVAGALAIVIALIFALRWGGKKLFVSGSNNRSTRAVQVLAKSSISPRQHILLLRVGRRVIVVGNSGAQMNPLSEITDADEVAALLGQLQDEKTALPAKAFSVLFSRARQEMGDDEENLSADEAASRDLSEDDAEEPRDEAVVSDTRVEITGLMDKIRVLSKHFRSGEA